VSYRGRAARAWVGGRSESTSGRWQKERACGELRQPTARRSSHAQALGVPCLVRDPTLCTGVVPAGGTSVVAGGKQPTADSAAPIPRFATAEPSGSSATCAPGPSPLQGTPPTDHTPLEHNGPRRRTVTDTTERTGAPFGRREVAQGASWKRTGTGTLVPWCLVDRATACQVDGRCVFGDSACKGPGMVVCVRAFSSSCAREDLMMLSASSCNHPLVKREGTSQNIHHHSMTTHTHTHTRTRAKGGHAHQGRAIARHHEQQAGWDHGSHRYMLIAQERGAALAHPLMHADLRGPFPGLAQLAPTHSLHSRRHPPAQKSMPRTAL
jgi:hypothetical protein